MSNSIVRCPLSKSTDLNLVETLSSSALIKAYKRSLSIDISSEFKEFKDFKEIKFYHCKDSDFRFFYPEISASEEFYKKLQEFDFYYMEDKYEYSYAKSFIDSSNSVLEIGCGKGFFFNKIQPKKYVGLEFNRKAVEFAVNSGICVLNETIQTHSNNHKEIYDIVCAFQVLEHIPKVHEFIEASLKCLKPNGLLIYSVPSYDSFVSVGSNNLLNLPPHHVSWWSDRCLSNIANIFNLKLINIYHEKLSDHHRKWYAYTIILEGLKEVLSYKSFLLDSSLEFRILSKLASWGGMFLEKGFRNIQVRPNGHSVIAIYQKVGDLHACKTIAS